MSRRSSSPIGPFAPPGVYVRLLLVSVAVLIVGIVRLAVELNNAQQKVVTLEQELVGLKEFSAKGNVSSTSKPDAEPTTPMPELGERIIPGEGKITEILPPRVPGNADFVEISIGSDDGLLKGHQLDVVRGDKYLGKIRVVEATADKAVCEVVHKNKYGIIQRGDNVTTKL